MRWPTNKLRFLIYGQKVVLWGRTKMWNLKNHQSELVKSVHQNSRKGTSLSNGHLFSNSSKYFSFFLQKSPQPTVTKKQQLLHSYLRKWGTYSMTCTFSRPDDGAAKIWKYQVMKIQTREQISEIHEVLLLLLFIIVDLSYRQLGYLFLQKETFSELMDPKEVPLIECGLGKPRDILLVSYVMSK